MAACSGKYMESDKKTEMEFYSIPIDFCSALYKELNENIKMKSSTDNNCQIKKGLELALSGL